jgi:hypothetical protein
VRTLSDSLNFFKIQCVAVGTQLAQHWADIQHRDPS